MQAIKIIEEASPIPLRKFATRFQESSVSSVEDLMMRFDAAIDLSMSYSIPEPDEIPFDSQPFRPLDMFGHMQPPISEADELEVLKALSPLGRASRTRYAADNEFDSHDMHGEGNSQNEHSRSASVHGPPSDEVYTDAVTSARHSHSASPKAGTVQIGKVVNNKQNSTPAVNVMEELAALRSLTVSGLALSDAANFGAGGEDQTQAAASQYGHARMQGMETVASTTMSNARTLTRGDFASRSLPDHELSRSRLGGGLHSPAQRPSDNNTNISRMRSIDGAPVMSNFRLGSPFQRVPGGKEPCQVAPIYGAIGQKGAKTDASDARDDANTGLTGDVHIAANKKGHEDMRANAEILRARSQTPAIDAGLNHQANEDHGHESESVAKAAQK